ncbi:MAG: PEP-CTERM sorting domain-containing protein [Vicinamibacteria bacterium]
MRIALVPEPASFSLLALGLLAVATRRRGEN